MQSLLAARFSLLSTSLSLSLFLSFSLSSSLSFSLSLSLSKSIFLCFCLFSLSFCISPCLSPALSLLCLSLPPNPPPPLHFLSLSLSLPLFLARSFSLSLYDLYYVLFPLSTPLPLPCRHLLCTLAISLLLTNFLCLFCFFFHSISLSLLHWWCALRLVSLNVCTCATQEARVSEALVHLRQQLIEVFADPPPCVCVSCFKAVCCKLIACCFTVCVSWFILISP